jgi:adenine C2-methylase RlmN of 23S rRNA A2503 and tRNA A37
MAEETRIDVLGLLPDELDAALTAHFKARGQPAYRAKQARAWLYERDVFSFDELTDLPGPAQTHKRLAIPEAKAVPAGTYRVLVRVNGCQARHSPALTLEAP